MGGVITELHICDEAQARKGKQGHGCSKQKSTNVGDNEEWYIHIWEDQACVNKINKINK